MRRIYIFDYKFDDSIRMLMNMTSDFQKAVSDNRVYDRTYSHSKIRRAIREADEIWMLGHGSPYGLFSRPDNLHDIDRMLVDSRCVEFLRNKLCVAIWCNADKFAEKYSLTGLFSGMIISEQIECDWMLGFVPNKDMMNRCNDNFVTSMKHCLTEMQLEDIPEMMANLCTETDTHTIDYYNFNRLFYFKNGQRKFTSPNYVDN